MADWDDDDYEPELVSAPPPVVEDVKVGSQVVPDSQPTKEKPKSKQKEGASGLRMEGFDRTLNEEEKEKLSKRNDLKFAADLLGFKTDQLGYDDIVDKADFELWGTRVGEFLAKRHKATHYGDLLSKLLLAATENLAEKELRIVSSFLRTLADGKKGSEEKARKAKAKPTMKAASGKAKTSDLFDDYGDSKGGRTYDDDYDDFM